MSNKYSVVQNTFDFLTADSGGKVWGHMGTGLANAEDTLA